MKRCDNCENEATVFYQVTVNGKTEQKHLCTDCAKKEGIPMKLDAFEREFARMDRDFFNFSDSFFEAPMRLMNAFDRPDGFFGSLFALPETAREPAPQEQKEAAKTDRKQAGAQLSEPSAPQSLGALKAQLKRAVKQEDYLRAAALRDRIRAMEGGKAHEK